MAALQRQAPVALAFCGNPPHFSGMAITNNNGSTAGKVYGSTMITSGANSKPSILLTANNNRASGNQGSTNGQANGAPQSQTARGSSRGGTVGNAGVSGSTFTMLDNTIVSLDALYESSADQASWVSYAAVITGEWDLCANCMPDAGGKKLFRQFNFNLILLGLPPLLNAPDGAGTGTGVNVEVGFDFTGVNAPFCQIQHTFIPSSAWYVAQEGLGLSNPKVHLDPNSGTMIYHPGDPIYDFFITIPIGTTVKACVFGDDGQPGKSVVLDTVLI